MLHDAFSRRRYTKLTRAFDDSHKPNCYIGQWDSFTLSNTNRQVSYKSTKQLQAEQAKEITEIY